MNHLWLHHFTYGGIHQLLVMDLIQSPSNLGETEFLGLWMRSLWPGWASVARTELAWEAQKGGRKEMEKMEYSLLKLLDLWQERNPVDMFYNLPFIPLPSEFQTAFFAQSSCSVPFCSSLMYFKTWVIFSWRNAHKTVCLYHHFWLFI